MISFQIHFTINIFSIACRECDRLTEAILEYYEASKQASREVQLWSDDQVYVLQMTFMDNNNPNEVKRLACSLEGRSYVFEIVLKYFMVESVVIYPNC